MKKVLFAFAALMILAACGNKQAAAPETESSEVTNEVVTNDTISKEMKEANMQEVQAYLKECGAFFIATADGDQPPCACLRRIRDYRWPSLHHDGQGEGRLQADGSKRQIRDLRLEEIWQRMDAPERNPGQRRDTGRQGGIPEPQRELEVDV